MFVKSLKSQLHLRNLYKLNNNLSNAQVPTFFKNALAKENCVTTFIVVLNVLEELKEKI